MSSDSTKGNRYQKKDMCRESFASYTTTHKPSFFSPRLSFFRVYKMAFYTHGSKQYAWFWEGHHRELHSHQHPQKPLNSRTGWKLSEALPSFHSTAHQEGHNEVSWWVAMVHLEGVSGFWAKRQKRDPKGRLCPWPPLPSLVLIFIGPSAS